jgi:hypothetical protein
MPQLMYECKLYKHLNGGPGIPNVFFPFHAFDSRFSSPLFLYQIKWFGTEGNYNVMVMDLLGKSLEDLVTSQPGRRFSLKTMIMLADQMISRLEFLHLRDYVCI